MPAHLLEFAANVDNHDLTHPNSLHDAWLDHLNISETRWKDPTSGSTVRIDAQFLGPRHDRLIHLTYLDVRGYELKSPLTFSAMPPINTAHGDLLIHEMRIDEENSFSHELLFSKGTTVWIQFTNFAHRVEMLS